MTREFEEALDAVLADFQLHPGGEGSDGADMIASGVKRDDCLEFLQTMMEGERITAEFLSVLVQMAVSTGVRLERARWQPA